MAGIANSRVTLRREAQPELTGAQEKPGWWEQVTASARTQIDDIGTIQDNRLLGNYDALEDSLVDLGYDRAKYRTSILTQINPFEGNLARFDVEAILSDVRAARSRNPKLFKDMPDSRAEFEKWVLNRKGGSTRDEVLLDEGGSKSARIIGGIAGSMVDPLNLATLPLGGGGKTIVSAVLREAALNAGVEAVQQPILAQNRERRGLDLTMGEAAANIGFAAGGAALLTGAGMGIAKNWDSIAGLPKATQEAVWAKIVPMIPEPLRPKIKGFDDIPDELLPDIVRSLAGDEGLTPDVRAAISTADQLAQVRAASPFMPTRTGDDLNMDLFAKAMQDVLDGVKPSPRPMVSARPADLRGGTAIGTGTISATPAREALKARIGRVENATGSNTARNPRSSATGKFQFTEGTWRALYQRRFGEGLSAGEIAAKRSNPHLQDLLMDDLVEANSRALRKSGQAETAGNLYLAHFAGSQGAVRLLEADGSATARSVLGDAVVRANPFLKDWSAADVVAWAHRKMGEEAPARGAGRTVLVGDDASAEFQRILDSLDAEAARIDDELLRADGDPSVADMVRVDRAMDREVAPIDMPRLDEDVDTPLLQAPAGKAVERDVADPAPAVPVEQLRPEVVALLPKVKAAIDDAKRPSLNPAKLAKSLGANEGDVFAALSELVRQGAGLYQTAGRRAVVKAGDKATPHRFQRMPTNVGPVDALTFIARRGGVRDGVKDDRWDGSGPNLRKGFRAANGRWRAGLDIDRFVPGAGPLIRDGGRSLDELGEILDEAGYLRTADPAQLAMGNTRPTTDEVQEFLADLVNNKRKIYPGQREDDMPEPDDEWVAEFSYHLDTAAERWGVELDADDRMLAQQLHAGDFDQTLLELVNVRMGEADLDNFIEADGDGGDIYQWEAAFDGDAGAGEQFARGLDGRTADGRDAGEIGQSIEELRSAEFARLGLGRLNEEDSLAAFADADGPGVDAQIESIGHDLEMMFDPPPREVDPALAERQAQEVQLRAEAPLQGSAKTGQAQDGTMGLGLFDSVDQPGFRLDVDGKLRSFDAIIKDLDEQEAGLKAARDCTAPKGTGE